MFNQTSFIFNNEKDSTSELNKVVGKGCNRLFVTITYTGKDILYGVGNLSLMKKTLIETAICLICKLCESLTYPKGLISTIWIQFDPSMDKWLDPL